MDTMAKGQGQRRVDPDHVLWFIMALPAFALIGAGLLGHKTDFLAWSGLFSCWFIIVAMMVTPLTLVAGPMPWLKARRRYFGVAGFAYASLHLAFWLAKTDVGRFLHSFARPEVLTGWIAFAIFVPLALTSTNRAVRRLGPKWKTLQRWIYPAAALTFLHWISTTDDRTLAILSSLPLILLSLWRIVRWQTRPRRA